MQATAALEQRNALRLLPKADALHHLRAAALFPQKRSEMITRALQELLISLPAVGTALIWPSSESERKVPWKVYYAGTWPESMQPWLRARLNCSLDATLGALQQDLSKLSDMPLPQILHLQSPKGALAGLWIAWPFMPLTSASDYQEEVRLMLEALIEVECMEKHYFSESSPLSDRALIEALGQADPQALSALLGLVRMVGNAELTFWGWAYQDAVEVSDHMGAKNSGFGFVLPRGQGVGGYIAAHGTPIITLNDYRNSRYRYHSATDAKDSEQIRSLIALPIYSSHGDEEKYVAGILYATRRTIKPFSLVEQLLMQRMTYLLEPLPPLTRSPAFLSPGLPSVSDRAAAWYKLILQANRIEDLEAWAGQFTKGTIIVTDSDGRPYVSARSAQLEHLREVHDSSTEGVQVVSLEAPGVSSPGQVYMRSAITLPPASWPDFFADLVVACNLIIGRMEQARDLLAHQRERWLQTVLEEKSLSHARQEGYRLGLPAEEGQLWVIAWPSQKPLTRQAARQRMLAENTVLDQLKSPLLFLGDDIGVILLDKYAQPEPSELREALLARFAPHPFWIVYGAHYHSLSDLKIALKQSVSQAQNARREEHGEYLLDMQTLGLESLLANPRLSIELRSFATRLIAPLLEYDKSKDIELTTTFMLAQTLGSAQAVADELGIHVNTVRYRLNKIADLLEGDDSDPKIHAERALAAFIWNSID